MQEVNEARMKRLSRYDGKIGIEGEDGAQEIVIRIRFGRAKIEEEYAGLAVM